MNSLAVHVLQHVPFEGLGSIATWLESRDAHVRTTRLFAGDAAALGERELLATAPASYRAINGLMNDVLDYLVE